MKLLQQLIFATVTVFLATAFAPRAVAKAAHHVHAKPNSAAKPVQQPAGRGWHRFSGPAPAATPHEVVGNEPVPPAPTLDAKSWLLMDYTTGQVLAENSADSRVEPASITKVMTAYIVSAELAKGKIKMDDPVFISENAWRSGGASTEGSTSFLAINSKVPLKDLLYGMIIQSGNDAAIALAEHVAGSEATFAQLMNQYAAQLGMSNSHFTNASGLPDPNHYSTAHDIGLLARAVIHDYRGLQDLRDQGVRVERHHPAQPQFAVVARSDRGRHKTDHTAMPATA